jgi:uncharacterized Zn finger protein (UPF0148 family)
MDDYVDESCEQCNTELVKLGGEYHCPNCEDAQEFTLDGKDYDFKV